MKKTLFFSLQISLCTIGHLYCSSSIAQAQVTIDGTLDTQVTQDGNVAEITGGETRGDNLFHSFQDFSVGTGNEAFFNNANDISNIFSRVTGGNISTIDGLIRANGSASLFLINPAGIIFGANARLDIGGSFYGSSASSILFEDGEFSAADLENPPLLTVNAPIGLGFRDNPAEITNSSVADDLGLQVLPGQKINLLGGNLNLAGGKITAPGGIINLGGLSTAGTIAIEEDGNLSFPDNVAKANVFLTDNAVVNITSDGGGLITINADNLELTGESLFLANIGEGLGSENAVAGTIQIDATRIFANNESQIRSDNLGIGQAGTVNINADTVDFDDNSAIVVSTFGQGDAGTVNITAQDISFEQEWGGIYSTVGLSRVATDDPVAEAEGNGGEININTGTLELANAARISVNSVAQGDAGNINISATGEVSFSGVGDTFVPAFNGTVISGASSQLQFDGVGNSGQINIAADSLNLSDKGAVLVDNSSLGGDAGDITLDIQNNISLDQGALILAQVLEGAEGNGGDINIAANSYESKGGSSVSADNQGIGDGGDINFDIEETISLDEESRILTELGENAVGKAGDITITANSLNLNSSSNIIAQTEGQGDAGEISITANEAISLNQSQISSLVDSSATGNGADISLTSGELNLTNESRIIANIDGQSVSPDDISTAGDIDLDIAGEINLDNGSQIQSQVGEDAVGNAGNITIETGNSLISTNGSQILTDSQGNGSGGDIQITVGDSIELRDTSLIFANTSGQSIGNAGSVTLEVGNTFSLSESLVLSQIQGEAEGNAGGIDITANTIDINNFSLVSTNAQAGTLGAAGNINLNGANISINTGSVVDALTENGFQGGNIVISGGNLEIVSGGVVVTSADNTGDAGSINLDLTSDLTINGEGAIPRPEDIFSLDEQVLKDLQESTGLFASSSAASTGSGGNIEVINGEDITISNNGIISVDSQGEGDGGIIKINTDSLNLDSKAAISAITASGNGGDINLTVADTINLENNSIISTQASGNGNGGNINIDTNFIVAFPNQDNDIVANTQAGEGGNINITAQSVLGIVERDSNPPNNTNDIDASSEFGLNGTVSIFTPDTNTLQGEAELPSNIVEPQQTTTQACNADRGAVAQSNLTLKGRGGIGSGPHLPLNPENISINGEFSNSTSAIPQPIETSQGKIQPARGIKVTEDGSIILTAYRTNNAGDKPNGIAPQRISEIKRNCDQI